MNETVHNQSAENDAAIPTSSLFSISNWSFPSGFYGNTKETVSSSLHNELDDLQDDSFNSMVDSATFDQKKQQHPAGIAFSGNSLERKQFSQNPLQQEKQDFFHKQQQQLTPSPNNLTSSANDDEKTIEDNLSYQFDSSFVDSDMNSG